MQETEPRFAETSTPSPTGHSRRSLVRRLAVFAAVVVLLGLIAVIVPLLNISRFQRRIVTSLSESIGRPIHLDRISLTVLPLPGLTIENLVVEEDPAFGAEPFVRSNLVTARLRLSSLWRRRLEFTRISFTDPSINLVQRSDGESSDGKWNVESILLQAARIAAAPTGQAQRSAIPRFPYIEASGARFNLKLGQEKMPVSLTEGEFALWLNTPREWRLRLEGRPLRTDMSASEIGTLRMEGTLGRASTLDDVPVDLHAEWRGAALGDTSRTVLGHDAGLRGSLTLVSSLQGTLGKGAVQTTLHLTDLRRADFVPVHSLAIDAECQAAETGLFHAILDLSCSWPPGLAPGGRLLALTGSIPDTRHLSTASVQVGTPGIAAGTILDWARIASSRVGSGLSAKGTLTGSLALVPGSAWTGQLTLADAALTVPVVAPTPVFTDDLALRSMAETGKSQFALAPLSLDLGEDDFATLGGHFDAAGYSLHLSGTAAPGKLLALGEALPQLGDGLAEALPQAPADARVRFDLISERLWGGTQVWRASRTPPAVPKRRRGRR